MALSGLVAGRPTRQRHNRGIYLTGVALAIKSAHIPFRNFSDEIGLVLCTTVRFLSWVVFDGGEVGTQFGFFFVVV